MDNKTKKELMILDPDYTGAASMVEDIINYVANGLAPEIDLDSDLEEETLTLKTRVRSTEPPARLASVKSLLSKKEDNK